MSELLTIALYMLICRELGQPAYFSGSEYFWTSLDDRDPTIFPATNTHTANEPFNHANSDVIVWKHLWQDFEVYLGVENPEPFFNKAAGQVPTNTLSNEIDMMVCARDKRGFGNVLWKIMEGGLRRSSGDLGVLQLGDGEGLVYGFVGA
jgi:hypothetical protein